MPRNQVAVVRDDEIDLLEQQWQQQHIDVWAAAEVEAMLRRLDGNCEISQRVTKDIEGALIKFLSKIVRLR